MRGSVLSHAWSNLVRPRITFTPVFVSPALSRAWRYGLAVFFFAWLALCARAIFHSAQRIHAGATIYGHLIFYLFLAGYLIYLLAKVLLLPPVDDPHSPKTPTK
jgi:hypothetical protein